MLFLPAELIDFSKNNMPGVKFLKTTSSFKWAYQAGNQGGLHLKPWF
jgi:hypothetical protein